MFSTGLIPPTDISHDLSNCLDTLGLVPQALSFTINTLTLCGTTYSINVAFDSQSELLNFLNLEFNNIYEYNGYWIIVNNHLIYADNGECNGTNCVDITTCFLLDENGVPLLDEVGFVLQPENC